MARRAESVVAIDDLLTAFGLSGIQQRLIWEKINVHVGLLAIEYGNKMQAHGLERGMELGRKE